MADPKSVVVEIGGLAVGLRTDDAGFAGQLVRRYEGFVNPTATPVLEFSIELLPLHSLPGGDDLRLVRRNGGWELERGEFRAGWDVASRRGWIRQTTNPYGVDALLRIWHTIELSRQKSFLVHAASAIRGGRAFLFAGASGAGKTTLARLAPPDVAILSDEISYVRRAREGYVAHGTPFAGELARVGENRSAPLQTLFLLEKGAVARVEPVPPAEAARALLRNILFFAEDPALVEAVFAAACEFAESVPVARLIFSPDASAWEVVR